MPWSQSTIPAGEDAARLANKPFLVTPNLLAKRYTQLPQWRVSGRWDTGTDISDYDTYCPWFATDLCADALSAPTSAVLGQSEVSLLFRADNVEWDTLLLLNHNFHSLGSTLVADFDLSDDDDFDPRRSPAPCTFSTFTNGRRRMAYGGLGVYRFASASVMRLRLRFTDASTFATIPRIGEVWLGRRRQLSYMSNEPWDPHHYRAKVDDHEPDGGHRVRAALNAGGRIIEIETVSDGPDLNGHDQAPEILSWYEECEWGTEPSILVFDGSSASTASPLIVYPEPELELPYLEVEQQEFVMRFEESAPFLARGL